MSDEPNEHLRAALGGMYPPRFRAAAYACGALGLLLAIGGAVASQTSGSIAVGLGVLGVLLLAAAAAVLFSGGGNASPAQIAREKAWAESLPFALEGYFDLLSTKPKSDCTIDTEIHFADETPSDEVLRAAWSHHDSKAHRIAARDGGVAMRSGSGAIAVPEVQLHQFKIYKNTSIPPYVHALVERVLVPLHRTHPAARVTLRRF